MTLMNSFGEFVDAEPPCAYPGLAAIDPKECRMSGPKMTWQVCEACGREFRSHTKRRTCSAACTGELRRREIVGWCEKYAS